MVEGRGRPRGRKKDSNGVDEAIANVDNAIRGLSLK